MEITKDSSIMFTILESDPSEAGAGVGGPAGSRVGVVANVRAFQTLVLDGAIWRRGPVDPVQRLVLSYLPPGGR